MHFHIFGLANIPTRKENTYEPFTPLTWNMAKMLKAAGHHVTFYGVEGSDAPCDEMVEIVPEMPLSMKHGAPTVAWLNYRDEERWDLFVKNGQQALRQRHQAGDISLMSFGNYQKFVAEESPLHCEFLCGYSGIFSNYKVFPSRAWMHYLYGELKMEVRPNWYDVVIPHYLDPDDFPFQQQKEDYLLFMGRLCVEKGPDIALDIANRSGMKILVAGLDHISHTIPEWLTNSPANVEFLGYIDTTRRLELMQRAKALIHPCRYIEPFGMVLIEALACGTPVIASDWGGPPEIIEEGITGFCCRDMGEFLAAVSRLDTINPVDCRRATLKNHSLSVAYPRYIKYFQRLQRTLGKGWYETQQETWRGPAIVSHVRKMGNGRLRGAEIGVSEGALSGYLLRELPNLCLDMIDPWETDLDYAKTGDEIATRSVERRQQDKSQAIRVTDCASDRRRILQMNSEKASRHVADGELDFVFIDADHSAAAVAKDLRLWARKVRRGGLICGHDYKHEGFPQWGVARAVDEYAKKVSQTVELGADWTWFLKKKDSTFAEAG